MEEALKHVEIKSEVCLPSNTVVVTGFGPFGKHKINASWEAVKLLPNSNLEKELGVCLVVDQVPVSYKDVETKVPEMWKQHNPMLVIHVGVSKVARKVTLEQVARKVGYVKKDVEGSLPPCCECHMGSSPVESSTLDLVQLHREINSNSTQVQTQLSDNAGRYLCEYIYYTSLSIDKSRSLFVHVPPLDTPYSAQELADGLADIVRCLVRQLRNTPNGAVKS